MHSGETPLLSICIPTYNRASSLRNLCGNLLLIKSRFGPLVDICVSNNASTDETLSVLQEYRGLLALRIVTQSSNIGGTLNIIAVSQMSRGDWGILIGDDDELVPDGIGGLLDYLKKTNPNSWVLVDAADLNGRAQYLPTFVEGERESRDFRKEVLRSG